MIMKILLCIVLLLVVLTLFAVWPGKRRDALRAPFLGRNCAHRGFFGKDQRPPENSLPALSQRPKTATALSWMYSLPRTGGLWFSTMIRWIV